MIKSKEEVAEILAAAEAMGPGPWARPWGESIDRARTIVPELVASHEELRYERDVFKAKLEAVLLEVLRDDLPERKPKSKGGG